MQQPQERAPNRKSSSAPPEHRATRPSPDPERSPTAAAGAGESFRYLFADSPDPQAIVTRERHLDCNRATLELFGYSKEAFLALNLTDLLPAYQPDGRPSGELILELMEQARARDTLRHELHMRRRDGTLVCLDLQLIAIRYGGAPALHVIGRDVTERLGTERRLRAAEERAQQFLDVASVMFVALDPRGRITLVNHRACEILGRSAQELTGADWFETCLPDRQRADVRRIFARIMRGELDATEYVENQVLCRDGQQRLIAWRNSYVRDDSGRIVGTLSAGEDITARREAELQLRASEEKLRHTFACSPDSIVVLDLEAAITQCNRRSLELHGLRSTDEAIGRSAFEFVATRDRARAREAIERTLQGGALSGVRLALLRRDGSEFIGGISLRVLQNDARESCGLVCVIQDVTARTRAEEALRKREEEYRLLIENSSEAIVVTQEGRLRFANPKALEVSGYSHEELLSIPFLEFVHPSDRQRVARYHLQRTQDEPTPERYMHRIIDRSGRTRWIENGGVRITWDGQPATLNFLSDVTERVRAEERLRRRESALRLITDNVPAMIAYIDRDGNYGFVNRVYAEALGLQSGSIVGRRVAGLLPAELADRIAPEMERALNGERVQFEMQVDLPTLDGAWLDVTYVPDRQGEEVRGFFTFIRDVSQRKALECSLREHQARLRSILDAIPDGIVALDRKLRVVDCNAAMREWVPAIAPRTACFSALWDRDQPCPSCPALQVLQDGETHGHMMKRTAPDGSEQHLMIDCHPIHDAEGQTIGIVEYVRDVSDRLRAEAERERLQVQLQQSQKMEALGTLAGGIAHDFNNLLTTITGYTELLEEALGEEHGLRGDVSEIRKAGERAARLTRQLLAFSRRQVLQMKAVDLNEAVSDMESMLRRLIGEDVQVETDLAPDLWSMRGDAGNLQQVLMNLATNARDAMPHGGTLLIRTENVNLGEAAQGNAESTPAGRFVRLLVRDTGCGMSAEVLRRLTEPFFTTKEAGKGTGLGLAVIYGIIEQHGGWIDVESAPGEGATFRIYLPALAQGAADQRLVASQRPPARGHGERILLVEDEAAVLQYAQRVLEQQGYRVMPASSAEEAREIFRQDAGQIDMLFSDVVLPGRSGLDLAADVRAADPRIAILLTSGYTDQRSRLATIHEQGIPFLAKPYAASELSQEIAQALSDRARVAR
ncbi:MAG: PAS domain S-box protein [Candidatus Eisenbacteria bacterium]|nr:PAS domain S-box protein [Candidatus Eisenbacteria bacterium]